MSTTIGKMIMSGHCQFPQSAHPEESHARCARNGGGVLSKPTKAWHPCPCPCHYGETYECGSCGQPIREALAWPLDEDGDLRYTHVARDGRAMGEDCTGQMVSRNEDLGLDDETDGEPVAGLLAMIEQVAAEDDDDNFAEMLAEFDLDE